MIIIISLKMIFVFIKSVLINLLRRCLGLVASTSISLGTDVEASAFLRKKRRKLVLSFRFFGDQIRQNKSERVTVHWSWCVSIQTWNTIIILRWVLSINNSCDRKLLLRMRLICLSCFNRCNKRSNWGVEIWLNYISLFLWCWLGLLIYDLIIWTLLILICRRVLKWFLPSKLTAINFSTILFILFF